MVKEKSEDFEVFSVGLVFASACSKLSLAETTRRLNAEHPTGISSQWSKHKGKFASGENNPTPCNLKPETHKHWLFSC